MAYVSQDPWIQNATLRDNILFGKEMNNNKYWRTIKNCQMTEDLDLLTARDLTEIGEKVFKTAV